MFSNTLCLLFLGDYITELCGDYSQPFSGSLLNNQFLMESTSFSSVFFVTVDSCENSTLLLQLKSRCHSCPHFGDTVQTTSSIALSSWQLLAEWIPHHLYLPLNHNPQAVPFFLSGDVREPKMLEADCWCDLFWHGEFT